MKRGGVLNGLGRKYFAKEVLVPLGNGEDLAVPRAD